MVAGEETEDRYQTESQLNLWLPMAKSRGLIMLTICYMYFIGSASIHCFQKCHLLYFYDNSIRCWPIYLILDKIIGQSIHNVTTPTYLLGTEIFLIVDYQHKCCSVADDAATDCHMIWSGAECCRQGH